MEDGVTEIESSILLQPRTPEVESEDFGVGNLDKSHKTKQVDEGGGDQGDEIRADGHGRLFNWLTGTTSETNDGREVVDKQDQEDTKRGGGGLLDFLVSPRSPRPIDVEVFQVEDAAKDNNDLGISGSSGNGGGGGVFDNLISSLLSHQNEESPGSGEPSASGNIEGSRTSLKPGDEDGGGGSSNITNSIMDNIMSHLPSSIPENAAPAPDEASILIHSIIHD